MASSSTYTPISQQPEIKPQLTAKELEQVREMQKWAQIRKQRREAAGLPAEGMNNRSETLDVAK
jgi:hypothetical protein